MAVVSERPSVSSVPLCPTCHRQHLDKLSEEAAWDRASKDESHVVCVKFHVRKCAFCTDVDINCRRSFFSRFTPRTAHSGDSVLCEVHMTHQELRIARDAVGASLYSEAPSRVGNSNLHLSGMRLDRKYEDTEMVWARDVVFPAVAIAMHRSRETPVFSLGASIFPRLRKLRLESETGSKRWFWIRASQHMTLECLRFCPRRVEQPTEEVYAPVATITPDPGYTFTRFDGVDRAATRQREGWDLMASKVFGVDLMTDAAGNPTLGDNILAVRHLPFFARKIFFDTLPRNIAAAIAGRIENVPPMQMTDDEQAELRGVTEALSICLRRDAKMIREIVTVLTLGDWKSKKWTITRSKTTLEQLRQRYNPTYQFKGQIKLEPSKPGKPPRLIIADGDYGQVMAWTIIATLERWIFKRYNHRSIKGVCKSDAMKRLIKNTAQFRPSTGRSTTREPVMVLENDGSAWDACMSVALRALTENVLMQEVHDITKDLFIMESHWQPERLRANKVKTLSLSVAAKFNCYDEHVPDDVRNALAAGKTYKEVIAAIRRSGCRGTSVLNFLANMILWCWVLGGKDGSRLMESNGQKFTDVFGVVRFVRMMFEGDDSLLTLTGARFTPEQVAQLSARWTKLGHRPKLFVRAPGDQAEFTGYKFLVDEHGLVPDSEVPDLPRLLGNVSYCHNRGAVDAAVKGDEAALHRAVDPGLLSRAYTIARKAPTVARWLYNQVKSTDLTFSNDDRVRLDDDLGDVLPELWKGTDGTEKMLEQAISWQTFVERVESEISAGEAAGFDEAGFAYAHGWCTSTEQWNDFLIALGAITRGTDSVVVGRVLPSCF
ncbi:RNA-dependent RNA polymerase [Beihai weivirus-like virus 12]|uniref:RNA-dependent RNA polymerase n=1 Tax=Beihai weivirus-like virus 12 TaxID=1922741 RepID=UPI000909C0C8|nr:RNA-dependent RNA polymerase [Beihai weivirus-like virus 12]APG78120.1 RNA-dependent RNA polymerase [Beihai weivirus-like virus 12]